MKNLIPILVFLLLFSGCSKKTDVEPKKQEPVALVQQPDPLDLETPPPSPGNGVLLDDSVFLDTLPETYDDWPEPPPEQPEAEAPKTFGPEKLAIDTVDSIRYLDDGGKFRDAIYLGSEQVGFQTTEFTKETIQGHRTNCMEVRNQIQVLLQGTPVDLSAEHRTYETLQGELIGSQSRIKGGSVFIDQDARVIDDKLVISSKFEDQTSKVELPWKIGSGVGGCCAIQVSLFKNQMQDNEERRVPFYDPTQQIIVDALLVAKEVETVNLPGQALNLRRIETKFGQVPITFWTDAFGNIVRMSRPFLETETLVTIRTKEP